MSPQQCQCSSDALGLWQVATRQVGHVLAAWTLIDSTASSLGDWKHSKQELLNPSTQHPETLWHATCQETTAISQKARQVSRWRTCPGLGIQPIGLSFDHLMIICYPLMSFDVLYSIAPLVKILRLQPYPDGIGTWYRYPGIWSAISECKMLRLLRPHCVLCVLCVLFRSLVLHRHCLHRWIARSIICR